MIIKNLNLLNYLYHELNKQKMAKHIPLKDFFKNPESASYQLSPDGKYLSYLAPHNRRMNIHVKNIETQVITRVTELEDRSVAGYMWVTNERLLSASAKF